MISSSVTPWWFIITPSTPHIRLQRATVARLGESAITRRFGRCAETSRAVRPESVGTMIAAALTSSAVWTALRAIPHAESRASRRTRRAFQSAVGAIVSVSRATSARVWTASTGKAPTALSCDSITASVPSRIALATSVTSARVGRALLTIDSSIWVAVIVGRA